jgi:hypothetical protein
MGSIPQLAAPVYSWFTEGFDTKDLIEAKAGGVNPHFRAMSSAENQSR